MGQFLDEEKTTSGSFVDEVPQETPKQESKQGYTLDSFLQSGALGPAPIILKHEELLPLLGQVAGGATGGFPGAVGGASVGNALKQGIEMLKGKRSEFKPGEVAGEAAITGLFEGAGRLPAFMIYRKLRAADNLKNGVGAELSLAKGVLGKIPNAAKIDDLLTPIQDGLKDITVQSGSQASQLRKWKVALESMKNSGKTHVDGRTLMQLEDQLGAVAQFSKDGARSEIKNVAANKLAKDLRSFVSKKVDDFAVANGLDSFPKLSKEVSKLIKITSQRTSPWDFMRRGALEGVVGGAVGVATRNPLAGMAAFGAIEGASNPATQKILFNALEKTGIGRGLTVGATQVGRGLFEESGNNSLGSGTAEASQVSIDKNKLERVESGGNQNAVSSAGAVGVRQITEPALKDFNQSNPGKKYTMDDMKSSKEKNREVSDWYIDDRIPQLLKSAGFADTKENRLRAYNQGIGSMQKGKFPKETKNYLKRNA